MPSPIDHLRHVAELAAAGKALGDDGPWLADAIRRYLEGAARGLTLDSTFGTEPMPFEPAWWEQEAAARRDELIHQMAAHFRQYATARSRQAKEIAAAARRYETRCWPRDQHRDKCPPHHVDKLEMLFFAAHRSGARWPLAWRRILEVLETKRELFAVGRPSDCKVARARIGYETK